MTTNRIIAILALIIFVGACIGSFLLGRATVKADIEVKRDTVYKYDTIIKRKPQPTSSKITGTQRVKAVTVKPRPQLPNTLPNTLPNCSSEIERMDSIATPKQEQPVIERKDSVEEHKDSLAIELPMAEPIDSIEVELPITERTYLDEQYKIVIEGYNPVLQSVELYPRTVYVTTTEKAKESRFAVVVGVQTGAGWTPKGFQPYAGFGATVGVKIKF